MLLAILSGNDIIQWASLALLAFTLWRITRGGGGSAVQELSAANRVLEKRNHDLGAEVRDLRIEVEKLRARTDFAAVMAQHEEQAQKRAEGILTVLDLIAGKLGTDE